MQGLIDGQAEFVRRIFGDLSGNYPLRSLKDVHRPFRLNSGQVARRHVILRQTLEDWDLPFDVKERWLKADDAIGRQLTQLSGSLTNGHRPDSHSDPTTDAS